MNYSPINEDMRRFILIHIPSIPFLEAILLMRADADSLWDINQIAKRLYINEKSAATLLTQLYDAGIIERLNKEPILYRYQPHAEKFKENMDKLAEIYAKNLIAVTNLIHSSVNKKAQKFANAFIWRKDK